MAKVEIKVKVKTSSKELTLTEEEARDIYEALDRFFGKEEKVTYIPYKQWDYSKVWCTSPSVEVTYSGGTSNE